MCNGSTLLKCKNQKRIIQILIIKNDVKFFISISFFSPFKIFKTYSTIWWEEWPTEFTEQILSGSAVP